MNARSLGRDAQVEKRDAKRETRRKIFDAGPPWKSWDDTKDVDEERVRLKFKAMH